MKTTKLMLLAIIFAMTTVGMAQSESTFETAPNPDPQSVVIQLKTALQNRALVYAMRTQLTPQFLKVEKPMYNVPVKLTNRVVYVAGTYKEWKGFFNIHSDKNLACNDTGRIPLKQAMRDARLVQTMHEQLTPAILHDEQQVYTARVKYNNTTVYVFGTYNEWKWFFRTDVNTNPLDT